MTFTFFFEYFDTGGSIYCCWGGIMQADDVGTATLEGTIYEGAIYNNALIGSLAGIAGAGTQERNGLPCAL